MRKTLLFGAAAMFGIIATDPAFCVQDAAATTAQTQPDEPAGPDVPSTPPIGEPAPPAPPIAEPLPPEMPPSPDRAPIMREDVPVGPMATPPALRGEAAVSGGTTSAMLTPQAATKAYPVCSKTLQDNCRNPGEGTRAAKRPRR